MDLADLVRALDLSGLETPDDLTLHVDPVAPNVRRVLMFAREKEIDLRTRMIEPKVDGVSDARITALNPLAQIPVLESSEGWAISESMAICRYLDERFDSTPALFGEGLEARARIHMWSRRAELWLFTPAVDYGHHKHPLFAAGGFDQSARVASDNLERIERAFNLFDDALGDTRCLAGDDFSAADVVAYSGLCLARVWRVEAPESLDHLKRWEQEVAARPSAALARYE